MACGEQVEHTFDPRTDPHSGNRRTPHDYSWWIPTAIGMSWGWYKLRSKRLSAQPNKLHTMTHQQHEVMVFFPDDKLPPLMIRSPTPFLSAKHVMTLVEEHTGLSLRTHHPRSPGCKARATWSSPPTELAVHRSHQGLLGGGGPTLDELWVTAEWLAIKRRWAKDCKKMKAMTKLSKVGWETLSVAIKEYHERIKGKDGTPDGIFSLANFDEIFGKSEKESWRERLFIKTEHRAADARRQQDILLALAPLVLQDYPLRADFLLLMCENCRRSNRPNLIHLYSNKVTQSTMDLTNVASTTAAQIIEQVLNDKTPSQRLTADCWEGNFVPTTTQQTKMLLTRCLMVENMKQGLIEGLEPPQSPTAAKTASPKAGPPLPTYQPHYSGAPPHLHGHLENLTPSPPPGQ